MQGNSHRHNTNSVFNNNDKNYSSPFASAPFLTNAPLYANSEEVPLPYGWEKAFDKESGRIYYFNRINNITTWDDPRGDQIQTYRPDHVKSTSSSDQVYFVPQNSMYMKSQDHQPMLNYNRSVHSSQPVKPNIPKYLCEAYPLWEIQEDQVTACFGCGVQFGYFKRKHTCRCCFHIYCNTCAANKNTIKTLGIANQRVCSTCHGHLPNQKCLVRLLPYVATISKLTPIGESTTIKALEEIKELVQPTYFVANPQRISVATAMMNIICNSTLETELCLSLDIMCTLINRKARVYESPYFKKFIDSLPLVARLESRLVQISVFNIVSTMALDKVYLNHIYETDLPSYMFQFIHSPDTEIAEAALRALYSLLISSDAKSEIYSVLGNIDFLTPANSIYESNGEVIDLYSGILEKLSENVPMREKMHNNSSLDIIVRLMQSEHSSSHASTISAILNMCKYKPFYEEFVGVGCIQSLLSYVTRFNDSALLKKVCEFVYSSLRDITDAELKSILIDSLLRSLPSIASSLSSGSNQVRKTLLDILSILSDVPLLRGEFDYEGVIMALSSLLFSMDTLPSTDTYQICCILTKLANVQEYSKTLLDCGSLDTMNLLLKSKDDLLLTQTIQLLSKIVQFRSLHEHLKELDILSIYNIILIDNLNLKVSAMQLLQTLSGIDSILLKMKEMNIIHRLVSITMTSTPTIKVLTYNFIKHLLASEDAVATLIDSKSVDSLLNSIDIETSHHLFEILLRISESNVMNELIASSSALSSIVKTIEISLSNHLKNGDIPTLGINLLCSLKWDNHPNRVIDADISRVATQAMFYDNSDVVKVALRLFTSILPLLPQSELSRVCNQHVLSRIFSLLSQDHFRKECITILSVLITHNPSSLRFIQIEELLSTIMLQAKASKDDVMIHQVLRLFSVMPPNVLATFFTELRSVEFIGLVDSVMSSQSTFIREDIECCAIVMTTISQQLPQTQRIEILNKLFVQSDNIDTKVRLCHSILLACENRSDIIKLYSCGGVKLMLDFIESAVKVSHDNAIIVSMGILSQVSHIPHYLKEIVESNYFKLVFPLFENQVLHFEHIHHVTYLMLRYIEQDLGSTVFGNYLEGIVGILKMMPMTTNNTAITDSIAHMFQVIRKVIGEPECLSSFIHLEGVNVLISSLLDGPETRIFDAILSIVEYIQDSDIYSNAFNLKDIERAQMFTLLSYLPDRRVFKVILDALSEHNATDLPNSYFNSLISLLFEEIHIDLVQQGDITIISKLTMLFKCAPPRTSYLKYIDNISSLVPAIEFYANSLIAQGNEEVDSMDSNSQIMASLLALFNYVLSKVHISKYIELAELLYAPLVNVYKWAFNSPNPCTYLSTNLLDLLFPILSIEKHRISFMEKELEKHLFSLVQTSSHPQGNADLTPIIVSSVMLLQSLACAKHVHLNKSFNTAIPSLLNTINNGVPYDVLVKMLSLIQLLSSNAENLKDIDSVLILPLTSLLYNNDPFLVNMTLDILKNMAYHIHLSPTIRVCIDRDILENLYTKDAYSKCLVQNLESLLIFDDDYNSDGEEQSSYVSTVEIIDPSSQ